MTELRQRKKHFSEKLARKRRERDMIEEPRHTEPEERSWPRGKPICVFWQEFEKRAKEGESGE